MATFVLTAGNDTFVGTPNVDFFDGISTDGNPGARGGTDILSGGGGNDVFYLAPAYGDGGSIDGGDDVDTVYFSGETLGTISFVNVENLIVQSYEVALSLQQILSFHSITLQAGGNIYLTGAGGRSTSQASLPERRACRSAGFRFHPAWP